ncbi:putative penicillin-binding protein repressor [Lachnospiraceae bacterium TWA4]|nr:putative penicillin-binding protein repressor [Lachnospiraceae bacterium TWA4]
MGIKNSKGRIWSKVLIVLLVLALVLCGLGYGVFRYYYGKMNRFDKFFSGSIETQSEETASPTLETLSEEDIRKQIEDKADTVMSSSDVFNILLIGTDGRKGGNSGRSDAIMLLSINNKENKISLTSLMRDIYVDIPGYGSNRLNASYAFGKEELLKQVIEEYFGVDIDRCVQINFYSFIEAVDVVGGVDIDLYQAEIPMLNKYVESLHKENGADLDLLDENGTDGTYHLSGVQALAYTRIRYIGNGDFERTERQRKVLTKIKDSSKDMSLLKLNDLLNKVLPLVTTDLSQGECFSLLLNASSYMNDYGFSTNRVPYGDTGKSARINRKSVLSIDIAANRKFLQKLIYHPSELENETKSESSTN